MSPSAAAHVQKQSDGAIIRQTSVSTPHVSRHIRDASLAASIATSEYSEISHNSGDTFHGDQPTLFTDVRPLTIQPLYRFPAAPTSQSSDSSRSSRAAREPHPLSKSALDDGNTSGSSGALRGLGSRRRSPIDPKSTIKPVHEEGLDAAEGALDSPEVSANAFPRPPSMGAMPRLSRPLPLKLNGRSSVYMDLENGPSPPTPGQDDQPYIEFALDQLTRDEEVRGSREYAEPSGYRRFLDPVQPQYHAYSGGPSRPSVERPRTPPRIAVANPRGQSVEIYRPDLPIPVQSLEPPPRSPRRPPSQISIKPPFTHTATSSSTNASITGATNRWANQVIKEANNDTIAQTSKSSDHPSMFFPVTDPGKSYYPSLDFIPGTLMPIQMLSFILLVAIVTLLLVIAAIWSAARDGLLPYTYFGDATYFLYRYMPTLLGMLIYLWLVQIVTATYRIVPFAAMTSVVTRARIEGPTLPLYPRSFFWLVAGHFKAQQWVVGVWFVVAWLQIFTVPLLACSFNTFQFESGQFNWTASYGPIWVTIALYIALIAATASLLVWFSWQKTGLRWDPRNLADIVALLARSNALAPTELIDREYNPPRFGYWRAGVGGREIFHTYGIAHKPSRQYHVQDGQIREKALPIVRNSGVMTALPKRSVPLKGQGRAMPWFLKLGFALLWPTLAILLVVAILVVSWIPQITIQDSFAPMLSALVSRHGFGASPFVFSFIPALIGMICFVGWLDIDHAYRRLQPFDEMLKEERRPAEKTLLTTYPCDLPILVTVRAFANGHSRVAIMSLTTLIAATLPILGGGVFWTQFFIPTQTIGVSAHLPAYYALNVFLVVLALSFVLVVPSARLRTLNATLPPTNSLSTFEDFITLFGPSKMLDDYAFHSPHSRIDLNTRLLSSAPGASAGAAIVPPKPLGGNDAAALSKASLADSLLGLSEARVQAQLSSLGALEAGTLAGAVPKYGLGVHVGRDGVEHLCVDRGRTVKTLAPQL